MKTESIIIDFISQELITDVGDDAITVDDRLLTSGVLDSLTVMQLVVFIEDQFDVAVPPEHITVENFQTVTNIVTYLNNSATDNGVK